MVDGLRRPEPARQGPGAGRARPPRPRPPRPGATDPHRTVDDAPFGGGAGMVLMAEPVFAAVEAVDPPRPLLYLSPAGRRLDQALARELAGARRLQPAVRALRGRRRAGARAPRRRRAVDRRLRARRRRGGRHGRARGGRPPGARRHGQRRVGRRRELQRRAPRVPALHAARRAPGLGGARGAALRRPRQGRPLAAGPGAGPHPAAPPRPPRGPRRAHRRGASSCSPSSTSERPGAYPRLSHAPGAHCHATHRSRRPVQPAHRHPRLRVPATR